MPAARAMATAATEARTEVAPLTPQNQGVRAENSLPASRIPIGNAIPMKNPIGSSIEVLAAIRPGMAAPRISCRIVGIRKPSAPSTMTMASIKRGTVRPSEPSGIRDVVKLPAALAISNEKRTTDRL